MNSKVDFYFDKAKKWKAEIELLRSIILDCPLTEELKWGCPCYTFSNEDKLKSNIVLIHVFKEYCALLFFKGALLKDENNLLIQQTKNVQAARQVRFINVQEITDKATILKDFISKAIEVEKAGLKVPLKETTAFEMVPEFKIKLAELPALKKAFAALTPGRQRAYMLHFAAPKQSKTRASRVEKCMPQILNGRGLNEA